MKYFRDYGNQYVNLGIEMPTSLDYIPLGKGKKFYNLTFELKIYKLFKSDFSYSNLCTFSPAHNSTRYRTVVNSEYTHINCVDIGLTGHSTELYIHDFQNKI